MIRVFYNKEGGHVKMMVMVENIQMAALHYITCGKETSPPPIVVLCTQLDVHTHLPQIDCNCKHALVCLIVVYIVPQWGRVREKRHSFIHRNSLWQHQHMSK